MDGQLISKKAQTFWEKARFTHANYQYYLDQKKSERFKLDIVDLLFVSNFKAGNGNIQEDAKAIEEKLVAHSNLLKKIYLSFKKEPSSKNELYKIKHLGDLSLEELNHLIAFTERLIDLCQNNKIDGFGVSYCSALFHLYFPKLIPVLDRRVLMGTGIVFKQEQMDSIAQVIKIEQYYKALITRLYEDLQADKFSDLESADKAYFILSTPKNLQVETLRESRRK